MDPDQTPRPAGEEAGARQRELQEDLAAVTRVLLGLEAREAAGSPGPDASDEDLAAQRLAITAKRRRLLDELSFLDD